MSALVRSHLPFEIAYKIPSSRVPSSDRVEKYVSPYFIIPYLPGSVLLGLWYYPLHLCSFVFNNRLMGPLADIWGSFTAQFNFFQYSEFSSYFIIPYLRFVLPNLKNIPLYFWGSFSLYQV